MKTTFLTIGTIFCVLTSLAQVDSVSFAKSQYAEIKTLNAEEIMVNKTKMNTVGEMTNYISLEGDCNYILPKYSDLTSGNLTFQKIKSDVEASLSALGSSLSAERKTEFYVYYVTRTRTFSCPENSQENRVSYGVGIYVILKVTDLKSRIDIKTPYDIAAAGQLGLAKVTLEVQHFGMTPSLADEFLPEKISDVGVEAAKFFDKLLETTTTKINDKNTIPTLLPIQL